MFKFIQNIDAQVNLGILYTNEFKDEAKAFYWLEKATLKGDGQACLNLGTMYAQGKGIEWDYTKAILWFQQSAEKGNEIAQ